MSLQSIMATLKFLLNRFALACKWQKIGLKLMTDPLVGCLILWGKYHGDVCELPYLVLVYVSCEHRSRACAYIWRLCYIMLNISSLLTVLVTFVLVTFVGYKRSNYLPLYLFVCAMF